MAAAVPSLIVTFHKDLDRPGCGWWDACRAGRRPVRGGYMPVGRGVIPHDLVHLVVEGHLEVSTGFWGLLARGATFRRGTDRRPTRPGRALVAAHRDDLRTAEHLGNTHHQAWLAGRPTPVAPAFDRVAGLWQALPPGGALRIEWPSLVTAAATVPVGSR